MTCVVGLVDGGAVYVGADSAWSNGETYDLAKGMKVFIKGEYIFGCSGSSRQAQLLRYVFEPPKFQNGDLGKFMASKFADEMRTCLKNGGLLKKTDNVERVDGHTIIGINGRLFVSEGDLQFTELITPYAAVGCGRDIARGSLFSTKGKEARERVKTALKAAERYSTCVRGPFVIKKI